MPERYTQVPRATLWLVHGGTLPSSDNEIGSFYIGKSPITNEQYEAFAPQHARSLLASADDHPVAGVTHEEAAAYCRWYAALAGKPFRLPTEPEWELACRGGTRGRWFFGDDATRADTFVWHAGNSGGSCHPVETLRANPAGVHDMLGNVWEWTAHAGGGDGELRVLRGGSCLTAVGEIGCHTRRLEEQSARFADVGFRIVRPL